MKSLWIGVLAATFVLLSGTAEADPADCSVSLVFSTKNKPLKLALTADVPDTVKVKGAGPFTIAGKKLELTNDAFKTLVSGLKAGDPPIKKTLEHSIAEIKADELPAELKPCVTTVGDQAALKPTLTIPVEKFTVVSTASGLDFTASDGAAATAWTTYYDVGAAKWRNLPLPLPEKARFLQGKATVVAKAGTTIAVLSVVEPAAGAPAVAPAAASCSFTPKFGADHPKFGADHIELTIAGAKPLDLKPAGTDGSTCVKSQQDDVLELDAECVSDKATAEDFGGVLTLELSWTTKQALPDSLKACFSTVPADATSATISVPIEVVRVELDTDGDSKLAFAHPKVATAGTRYFKDKKWTDLKDGGATALGKKRLLAAQANGNLVVLESASTDNKKPVTGSSGAADEQCLGVVEAKETTESYNRGRTIKHTTTRKVLGWCTEAEGSELVCIDFYCGGASLLVSPKRQVLPPNRGVVLRVRHKPGLGPSVVLRGNRELVELGASGGRSASGDKTVPHAARDQEAPPKAVVSTYAFTPRGPGIADLEVTKPPDGAAKKKKLRFEFQVETLTWGAVRFGFAALYGDIVSKTYEAQNFAGSSQPEIAVTKNPTFGWEATVGFAPYLLDLFACPGRGRSHTGGCNYWVAPYFGIGVVGQAPDGVSAFNSFHVGAEVEFASSFSFALTGVWRQVDTLRHGYAEGSAVEPGTAFTRTTSAFGLGAVLNVSPDFLQFATGGSAAETPRAPVVDEEEKTEKKDEQPKKGGGS